MYPSPAKLAKYAALHQLDRAARPLIMCEYSHAMGNSCGGLLEYWRTINAYSILQGGFIWDWLDQGLLLPPNSPKAMAAANRAMRRALPPKTAASRRASPAPWPPATPATDLYPSASEARVWGYGGDYGPQDTPSDENFCINGLMQPDRTPNPHAWEAKYAQQPISIALAEKSALSVLLTVSNHYDMISLDHLKAQWLYYEDGLVVRSGDLEIPPCGPGAKVTLRVTHTTKEQLLRHAPEADVETLLVVNLLPREGLEESAYIHALSTGLRAHLDQVVATEQFFLGVAAVSSSNASSKAVSNERGGSGASASATSSEPIIFKSKSAELKAFAARDSPGRMPSQDKKDAPRQDVTPASVLDSKRAAAISVNETGDESIVVSERAAARRLVCCIRYDSTV